MAVAATTHLWCVLLLFRTPCASWVHPRVRYLMPYRDTCRRYSSRSIPCACARSFAPLFCFKHRKPSACLYPTRSPCCSTFQQNKTISPHPITDFSSLYNLPKFNCRVTDALRMYLLAPDTTHLRGFVVFIQVGLTSRVFDALMPCMYLPPAARFLRSSPFYSIAMACHAALAASACVGTCGAHHVRPVVSVRYKCCGLIFFCIALMRVFFSCLHSIRTLLSQSTPPTSVQAAALYSPSWRRPRLRRIPRRLVLLPLMFRNSFIFLIWKCCRSWPTLLDDFVEFRYVSYRIPTTSFWQPTVVFAIFFLATHALFAVCFAAA